MLHSQETIGRQLAEYFDLLNVREESESAQYELEPIATEEENSLQSYFTLYRKWVGPFGIYGVLHVLNAPQNSFTKGIVVGAAGLHVVDLNKSAPTASFVNGIHTLKLDLGFNVFTQKMIARYCTRQLSTNQWHCYPWQTVISW